jgi:hypothetical protein
MEMSNLNGGRRGRALSSVGEWLASNSNELAWIVALAGGITLIGLSMGQ